MEAKFVSIFQDFGFVQWWKAIAVVLTGFFTFLAVVQDNRDKKTGKLTKWGIIAIFGIIISSVGGLLAQIIESADQAATDRNRHAEIISILAGERPLKIDKVYGEFRVLCEAAYLNFCNAVHAFRSANPTGINPISLFDTFPGGRNTVIGLSLRFFSNESNAKAQLIDYNDRISLYSAYMQLPLIAGNENKCGMRVAVFTPNDEIRLFIYESCPFVGVNNFGRLQSYLDLDGSEFSTQAGPYTAGLPPLEPKNITLVYSNASSDTISNLSKFELNNQVVYLAKFSTGDMLHRTQH
jgi:hypothetical protein